MWDLFIFKCFKSLLLSYFSNVKQILRACAVSFRYPKPVLQQKKNGNKKMRKSYPSDITREQFGIIRGDPEKAKKKNVRRHMTYTIYFVHCCICWKRTAHEEGFPMTSRTGKLCVTTTTYSPSRTRTASACLIKSCKNWSGQKEKSMVAPRKRPCLLWIPKVSAMQIPLRKTVYRDEISLEKTADFAKRAIVWFIYNLAKIQIQLRIKIYPHW